MHKEDKMQLPQKKSTNKRSMRIISATISLLLAVVLLPTTVSAWGPERTTYTNKKPADHATFNSITDNAGVGDERNFVRVGEANSSEPYTDEIEVVPGKEYEVYIYYHNDAGSDTNATGYGVATNSRIASAYPTILNTNERGMVSGILSWSYVDSSDDQVKTGKVWDEAYLTTKTDGVVLRYKTGTATIHNAGAANGSVLPTSLFTEKGTLLGFNKLAGTIPGCAEYSGYITYTLVAEKIDSELTKQVSLDGENWSEEVTAKPGDYVTYKVVFKNTGNTTLANTIFKDTHDESLSLRSGSTTVFDVDNTDGKSIDDIIDLSGYNVGDTAPGALVQIIYQAKVSEDKASCNKSLKNTIHLSYNSAEQKQDDATVIVTCDDEPEPDEPGSTCETNPEMDGCSEEKNCITNPEMEGCKELPNTGPMEIIMATVIVIGICGGGYYLYRTQKTLKTVEGNVVSKKTDKIAPENKDVKGPKSKKPKA